MPSLAEPDEVGATVDDIAKRDLMANRWSGTHRVAAGTGAAVVAVLVLRSLVTSAADPNFPCRVAAARVADPQLADPAVLQRLLGDRSAGSFDAAAQQLRDGRIGEVVADDEQQRVVAIQVSQPEPKSRLHELYAVVLAVAAPETAPLGYIVDYGEHRALEDSVDAEDGVDLVRSCEVNGERVPVHAGHLDSRYRIAIEQ